MPSPALRPIARRRRTAGSVALGSCRLCEARRSLLVLPDRLSNASPCLASDRPRRRRQTACGPVAARLKRRAADRIDTLLGLLRTYLLIPDTERFDLRLRRQRLRVRKLREPAFVLGTA